jgi:hypothetical protein
VLAVTFDFYNTLVCHRAETGRGRQYQEYLSAVGLACDPWEHQVLYDVFEYFGAAYRPTLTEAAKLSFWTEFTRRLFERTNTPSTRRRAASERVVDVRAEVHVRAAEVRGFRRTCSGHTRHHGPELICRLR